MSREEEIEKEAEKYAYKGVDDELKPMVKGIAIYLIDAFKTGTEFADQHPREGLWDAEKVVEFIKNNVREYHKSGVFHVDEFIKDLRKEMED